MAFVAHTKEGPCVAYQGAALGPDSKYVITRQGVGKGGVNLGAEVLALRRALNRIPASKGGPEKPLAEIQTVDDDLIRAIVRFKTANTPEDTTPLFKYGMKCEVVLNELLFEDQQLVKTNAEVLDAILSLIDDARSCIRAARNNLRMVRDARSGVGLPGDSPAARTRLVNRHFRLDLMPNYGTALSYVEGLFARMEQVFERPGNLWGRWIFTFDPNPPNAGWLAYAVAGGFYRGGEVEDGKRNDSIYLCELLRLSTRDGAVQTIVHELAHFCGPATGEKITDFGYGLPDHPKMRWLTPYQRLHNAECYGNFAFECKFGRDPGGMV